jgi:hypothetical protein
MRPSPRGALLTRILCVLRCGSAVMVPPTYLALRALFQRFREREASSRGDQSLAARHTGPPDRAVARQARSFRMLVLDLQRGKPGLPGRGQVSFDANAIVHRPAPVQLFSTVWSIPRPSRARGSQRSTKRSILGGKAPALFTRMSSRLSVVRTVTASLLIHSRSATSSCCGTTSSPRARSGVAAAAA